MCKICTILARKEEQYHIIISILVHQEIMIAALLHPKLWVSFPIISTKCRITNERLFCTKRTYLERVIMKSSAAKRCGCEHLRHCGPTANTWSLILLLRFTGLLLCLKQMWSHPTFWSILEERSNFVTLVSVATWLTPWPTHLLEQDHTWLWVQGELG